MTKKPRYDIQYLPIKDLVVNPENPRLIRDDSFKCLVKSLQDCPALFDARPCICSDRTSKNIIMGGNQRYLAAKELKYKEVPAIIMSGLTLKQEQEIAIKDNGDFGEWDMDILANAWDDLPLIDWGVDLSEDWLEPINDSNLPNAGSSKEKEEMTTCPKCGFEYAIK